MGLTSEQIKRTKEQAKRHKKPGRFPMLSADEEFALATAWRDHGDYAARNRLIEYHFPLAGKIAAKYDGGGIPLAWQVAQKPYHPKTAYPGRNDGGQQANDIGQVAILGLIEAANRFDPSLGARFGTYAFFWVRKVLNDHVNQGRKKCGVNKYGNDALSLDAPIKGDSDDDESDDKAGGTFLNMMIEGEDVGGEFYSVLYGPIPRPQEDILIRMHNEEIHDHATAVALAELDDRERRIFEARFLEDDELQVKFKDLAAEFKVSIPMTHKIAERAREKVRASYTRTIESMPHDYFSSNDDEGLKKAA
jgi:RNA polymerase sigma-32 factor